MRAESADFCLFAVFGGEDAEGDGDAGLDADFGETVCDGVGDVMIVLGVSLDDDADTDDGVVGFAVCEKCSDDGEFKGAWDADNVDVVFGNVAGEEGIDAIVNHGVGEVCVETGCGDGDAEAGTVESVEVVGFHRWMMR